MLDLTAVSGTASAGLDADRLAETLGAPPVAPLAMPRQVLERGPGAVRAGLALRLFGLGDARTSGPRTGH
ncbi:hypothetical protein [Ruixingdingia sedimenti]|uniref:Uncharacterized protein n=1 Tax=Ruixingdingia sedimenti TaxID=3073604 RepID=A0ABU1F9F9_9RHOB|nr:hypothetical protein [Xinfangfangia sp. LG-4]MDR5653218.1 hypothetical protein [Xinfangfangia sp. LG-4]